MQQNFQQIKAQPLWHRLVVDGGAGGQTVQPKATIRVFDKDQNAYPDVTNLEQGGSMPATTKFTISAIEIRPRPTCTPAALQKFLGHTRFLFELGHSKLNLINQPSTMFPSPLTVGNAGLDFCARAEQGLYRLGPEDTIVLEPNQPYNAHFDVDAAGFSLAAGEVLDVDVILKGVKQSSISL